MSIDELRAAAVLVDPETVAFYLHAPRSHVVLLQAYFELYDGVATVRTIIGEEHVVCVLTPKAQEEDCMHVLEAIRGEVHWEVTSRPPHDTLRATSTEDPPDQGE